MGLSTKKTTTTTTPEVSEPYDSAFQGYTGAITDFLNTDPHQYVAPADPLQTQAAKNAANLGGWSSYLKQGAGLAKAGANAPAPQVTPYGYAPPTLSGAYTFDGAQLGDAAQTDAARILPFMQDYQNPYTQQVIDATLADYDQQAAQQQAALQARGAIGGAFGGSRFGIAEGQLSGDLARGRAATEASLLDQQYRLAAQLAGQDAGYAQQAGLANMDAQNQFALAQGGFDQQAGLANMDTLNNFLMTQYGMDADAARYYADALNQANFGNANFTEQSYLRKLQAAGLAGNLGQTAGQLAQGDVGTQAGVGAQQRQIASEYANAVPTQLQIAGDLYSKLYPGIYAGQTGTGTQGGLGSWLPQLAGSAMQAGAMAFSDRRLKTNIELVKRDPDGLGWYTWNWKADPNGRQEYGVIADEVKDLRPWAYVENYRDGYAGVNYAALEMKNAA